MKRLQLGLIILAVLLLCCVGILLGIRQLQRPVSQSLEQAAQLCQEGNYDRAAAAAAQARQKWERGRRFTAAVADHEPVEEIDARFAILETFSPEKREFAALCRNLSQLTQALAEAHAFNWWNLL